jgi:hypothetical protein
MSTTERGSKDKSRLAVELLERRRFAGLEGFSVGLIGLGLGLGAGLLEMMGGMQVLLALELFDC